MFLEFFNGYPILQENENLIFIDTGSILTIHSSENLRFMNKDYKCSTNYRGLTVSDISDMLGTKITTLLGVDVLKDYTILLDYKAQIVEFSEKKIEISGFQTNISSFMGVPIIEVYIHNQKLYFFLDTGVRLSYLSENITYNYESIGTYSDFHPEIGKFQTAYYEIPTNFMGKKFLVKYGNLPSQLQMTMDLSSTDGIMGFDFFNNFRVVLDLENKKMKYARFEP